MSVAVNNDGEVFISDEDNHIVRMVDTNGIILTFAGTPGSSGYSGDGGLATNAQLNAPQGLTMSNDGELLIADIYNNVIRKVDKNRIISTIVAGLAYPVDVSVGRDGELYVVDNNRNRIAKFDNNGMTITVAGSGNDAGNFHLPENVPFAFVSSVAVLSDTELIVADTYNHTIKKVDINTKSIVSFTSPTLSYPVEPTL